MYLANPLGKAFMFLGLVKTERTETTRGENNSSKMNYERLAQKARILQLKADPNLKFQPELTLMTFNRAESSIFAILNWLYDRFIESIIYSSVWVAAALASLGLYVRATLDLGYDWQPIALIFCTALIPYNLDRIFDSYVQTIPDAKAQVFFRRPYIWALLCLAIAGTVVLLYRAPQRVRYVSIAGIVPLLYGTPIFPWKHKSRWQWYRLKDLPGSKAWIVGVTLTYAVIALPLAYAGARFDSMTALITLFMFVFIVTNSHVFDIRDVESDRRKGVVTLPILAGINGTKIILTAMNLSMLLVLAIALKSELLIYYPEIVFATATNLIYIWLVKIDTPRSVYTIWIEGCLFIPLLFTRVIIKIL